METYPCLALTIEILCKWCTDVCFKKNSNLKLNFLSLKFLGKCLGHQYFVGPLSNFLKYKKYSFLATNNRSGFFISAVFFFPVKLNSLFECFLSPVVYVRYLRLYGEVRWFFVAREEEVCIFVFNIRIGNLYDSYGLTICMNLHTRHGTHAGRGRGVLSPSPNLTLLPIPVPAPLVGIFFASFPLLLAGPAGTLFYIKKYKKI